MVDPLTAAIAIFVAVTILAAYGTRKAIQMQQGGGGDASTRHRKRSKGARDRRD